MQIRDGILEAIGHTPLIKLKRASAATGCTILGKAEFMNPGGSVKDRAGRQMILEAEQRGELRPGGLVVEATAGNTGIGLALALEGMALGARQLAGEANSVPLWFVIPTSGTHKRSARENQPQEGYAGRITCIRGKEIAEVW